MANCVETNSSCSINFTIEDCYEIIKNKTGTDDFQLISFQSVPVKHILGFLGDYSKLKINYKLNDVEHTLHCFSKSTATANELVKNVSRICFKKEEFVYNAYVPLLKSLGLGQLTTFVPDCYFIRSQEVIVMKDLSLDGFTCSTLSRPAGKEWLQIVIKQLARFHACSILCELELSKQAGRKLNLGDIYAEYLRETNFAHDKTYGQCMTFGVNNIYKYFFDKLEHIPGELSREEFKEEMQKLVQKVFTDLNKSEKYKNVICHRDLWVSNILLKKNEENDADCIFVDYQLIKYCPPAIDILFLFYINTDKQTRKNYMTTLLQTYYNELDDILKKYNTDLSKIFTFDSFLRSCEDLKSTSICQSLAYLQVLFLPDEVLIEINNDEEKAAKYYSQDRRDILDQAWKEERFKTRITELLDELFEICERNSKL